MASLQDQLAQARSDAADSRYDHEMEVRQSGYDKLAEDADKSLERITDLIQRDITVQNQLISDMLAKTQDNYTSVYKVINDTITDYGLKMSDVTTNVLKDLDNLGDKYGDVKNKVTAFADAIGQTNPDAIETKKITDVNTGTTATDKIISTVLDKETNTEGVSEAEAVKRERKAAEEKAKTESKVPKAVEDKKKSDAKNAAKAKHDSAVNKANDAVTKAEKALKTAKTNVEKKEKAYNTAKSNLADLKNQLKTIQTALKQTKNKKDIEALNKKYANTQAKIDKATLTRDNAKNELAKAKESVAQANATLKSAKEKLKTVKAQKYATGSKYIKQNQFGWTQDDGQELVFRRSDGAVLTPLGRGDKVFTAEMTDNLWNMAKLFDKDVMKQNVTDASKVTNINNKPTINMNFESFMTVEGNVDANVVDNIRDLKDEFYVDFTKRFTEDFGKLGHKLRF